MYSYIIHLLSKTIALEKKNLRAFRKQIYIFRNTKTQNKWNIYPFQKIHFQSLKKIVDRSIEVSSRVIPGVINSNWPNGWGQLPYKYRSGEKVGAVWDAPRMCL